MLRDSESETEILLGNKQLIGIFLLVAALLGGAFYGGYALGRGSMEKKMMPAASAAAAKEDTPSASNQDTTGGETHSFPADTAAAGDQTSSTAAVAAHPRDAQTGNSPRAEDLPLGSPKRKTVATAQRAPVNDTVANEAAAFAPQSGEQFLQVAAVSKDEAEAVAEVLHKKGFRAHAIAKPGNEKIYRVLIGPIQDAADLSSTREALRGTGFREVIVQRY